MSFRFPGLLTAAALLAAGVAQAQPASTGGGGSMAYPDSLPSGQVKITAPTARDTGSMAFPQSSGGVTEAAPMGRDTGSMATPETTNLNRGGRMTPAAMRAQGNVPMRPDVAPTPAQTATAQSLATAPSSAPVPYTDFLPPAHPAGRMSGHAMTGHHMAAHHAMKAKPAAAKAETTTTTTTTTAPAAK